MNNIFSQIITLESQFYKWNTPTCTKSNNFNIIIKLRPVEIMSCDFHKNSDKAKD